MVETGVDESAPVRPGRYARLRMSMGRHPADLLRLAVSAGLVLACLLIVRAPGVNPVESAIFVEVQQLPAWLAGSARVLGWAGSWPGIVVAAGTALYAGRVRMAASLAAAGVTALLLAQLLHWLTEPREGIGLTVLRQPLQEGFRFPAVHAAVLAALVTAAGPYLLRWVHRAGWALVVLTGAADVFLGTNLPVGAFAGAVLGWGAGTFYHLVLGAPGRRTSESAVQLALAAAGLPGARISAVGARWWRPYEYDITTPTGERLHMKVVRRMHRLAGPAYRVRRVLASVEMHHEPALSTTRHEVEHEAYMTLLAERAGVGVLPVVFAGQIEHGPPFLIRRHVDGQTLASLPTEAVDDGLLARIWCDVLLLGRHHVVHHGLRAENILIDDDGRPRITDFTLSRVGGASAQAPQDIAETLVTLASVVGVRRAVDSALRDVDRSALASALPHLQWLVVHRRQRSQLSQDRNTLAELRATLAEQIEQPPPRFRSPVRPLTVVIMVAVGLAVYLLLPQLSSLAEVRRSLTQADWRWIGVAIVAGLLGVPASGLTILGSARRSLPVGKTMAVQLAAAFTGRTTAAGIGFYGINFAFLERLGLRRAQAVGVVMLNRAVVGIITGVATALGILVIGNAVPVGRLTLPSGWPVIVAAVVIVGSLVGFLVSPLGRRVVWWRVRTALRELLHDLVPTLRNPVRAVQLIGGSVLFLLLQAGGLAATLAAFTPHFPLLAVLAVYVVGSTIGQLAPTPGGLGAVEAATVAGLTAIGVGPAAAVAAVLTSRALTFWLPVLPGLVAFRLLQHRQVI